MRCLDRLALGCAFALALTAVCPSNAAADPPEAPDPKPVLDAIGDLRLVRAETLLDPAACDGAIAVAAIPRGRGAPIKCLIRKTGTRCAAFARGDRARMTARRTGEPNISAPHPAQTLCDTEAGSARPAPAWLAPVVEAVRADTTIIPFNDGSGLILEALPRSGPGHHAAALWTGGAWRSVALASPEHFVRLSGPLTTLDASPLVGRPAWALIIGWYDGGSGMGTLHTGLTVVAVDGKGLRRIDDRPIGQLQWSATPAQRRDGPPEAAWDYRARPHDEVRLVPRIGRGVLRLTSAPGKACRALLEATTGVEDLIEQLAGLRRVCEVEGAWRLSDGGFVRAP